MKRRAQRAISILAILVMMVVWIGTGCSEVQNTENKMPDASHTDKDVNLGLFEDDRARSDEKITLSEVVTALARIAEANVTVSDDPVSAVQWAVTSGIAIEQNKSPDSDVTRQELCTMLTRFADQFSFPMPSGANDTAFADENEIADWAKESVKICSALQIISPKDENRFDPAGSVTCIEGESILNLFVTKCVIPSCGLQVHFIDVGQGDSTFMVLPNGKTMLIDAGEAPYGATVVNYIKGLGYTKIDYVIATHPHSDHIGGLTHVVQSLDIGKVYMPAKTTTTATFRNLLNAIDQKGLGVNTAKAGVGIDSGNGWSAKFLSPTESENDSNLNLYSAVVKLTYKNKAYLFMGDAEAENEGKITADVSADVIKVGHHGSNTSSSQSFVDRVKARYAVFSVGKDNSYGHPKSEILSRWKNSGAEIYRTDESGNIVSYSNGTMILMQGNASSSTDSDNSDKNENSSSVETSGGGIEWVLNTSTKKIHKPTCRYAKKISGSNYATTSKSVKGLIDSGYSACKNCNPSD